MSTLHITFSNSIERLMAKFSTIMQQPLPNDDVLTPEYVLIDNKVLGQWLNLQLAQQQGIAANIHYVQPSAFFWQLARALVAGDVPKHSPFAKENMAWQLMAILQDDVLLNRAEMQPVKEYLSGGVGQLKHYQLAQRIADLFDQYLIYRPEWIQQWNRKKTVTWQAPIAKQAQSVEAWQQLLWQQIMARSQAPQWQRAAVLDEILNTLKQGQSLTLPMQRLLVVGISTLPPSMIEILVQLGQYIDVHLLVLNPCQEFWFDSKSAKTWAKTAFSQQSRLRLQAHAEELLIGNPLLAANGQEVREFIETLIEREGEHAYIEEDYIEPIQKPMQDSLLHSIQHDILHMVYAGDQPASMAPHTQQVLIPKPLLPALHNVQLHICHSAMREVEVLHDQLLRLFDNDKNLMPRDVVVMMPDVSTFIPFIEAVFASTQDKLPYQITDKSWLEDSPLLSSIENLLGLPDSLFGLSNIVTLLEVEAVQAKYGINAQGFETLKEWLQEAGARWGINAEHRAKQGLPAYSEFSWEFAWHRLMAGYAMNSFEQGGDLLAIDNMLIDPFDAIEGSNTALLNSFYAFWQCLIHYKNVLSQSYSLVDWSLHLQALVDDFYDDIEVDSAALKMLRKECEALKSFEQEYTDKIDISVIRDWIKPLLNQASRGRNPWQEGIKFCSLMPMRAVPFKVVYLMGMNQADYPKQVDKPLFDLMRYDYRAGDRSRRVGDRWLFLEALLSARDAFFISYTGRDQRNNEERNPSVVVAELMDYLTNGYSTADNTSVIAQICTEHKLQPFNKDYFTANGHLFSYNPQAYAIASAVKNPNDQIANLTSYQKPDTFIQSVVDVELSSFIQFFIDPAKWFFKHQYATWLAIDNTKIDDDELFNLPMGLGDWQLRNAMREYVAANPDCQEDCLTVLESVEQLWRAKGLWPLGLAGDALKEKALEKIKPDWLFALKRIHTPVSMQTIHHKIVVEQGELTIQGALHLRGTVHFLHSASASKSKTALELAIKTALLAQTTNEVTEVKEITFDGKIKAGLRERVYNITQNPQHALFLQALAKLYVQYQHTGLPYEFDVANALVAGESIHHLWAGGYNDGGLQQNPETRFYYHSVHHLQSESFLQVAKEMHSALSAWQNENPDASAKSPAKKSSKKTKEDNNVV